MKKIIDTGRALENGIVFYSNKSPMLCKTYYNKNGEIEKEILPIFFDNLSRDYSKSKQFFKFKTWHIVLFNMILFCFCVFVLKDFYSASASIFFAFAGSRKFFNFIESVLFMNSFKDLPKFHAAEHMAINAYEKLGRIPTIEELKKASRFSNLCGSVSKTINGLYFLVSSITIAIFARYSIWIYIPICILVCACLSIKKINVLYLKYFQILFTKKPTDRELKLALVALENFEKMENSICVSSTKNSTCIFCCANLGD